MAKMLTTKYGSLKVIVEQVAQRMLDGERIELDEEVKRYFDPQSLLSTMRARGKFVSILNRAMKIVEERGGIAGSLGNCTFGVPENENELTRMASARYFQLKGRNKNAAKMVTFARAKKLISDDLGSSLHKMYDNVDKALTSSPIQQ